MDFSKIRDAVISLSTLLVGHATWFAISLYSIWTAYGFQLDIQLEEFSNASISILNSDAAKLLLDTYALKPLLPALVVFVVIFILHVHKELLVRIGQYIPPELVWHWMPGLRDISVGRWKHVLRQMGPSFTFEKIRCIVEERYADAIKEYSHINYSSTYNIFKALAFLNFFLLLTNLNNFALASFYLFVIFIFASFITAVLEIYHSRNSSRWAIDNIFRKLLAQRAIGEIDAIEGEKEFDENEIKHIDEFCISDSKQPIVELSWSIPLLGNLWILRESLFRHKGIFDK